MTHPAEALCNALQPRSRREPSRLASLTAADWEDVVTLGIRQRVATLLGADPTLKMPDEVRRRLGERAQRSAIRALRHRSEFQQLAAAVAPLGIQVIALKGIHLASAVYQSPALREMVDIDVLVAPEHVDLMHDAAVRLGYVPSAAPDSGAGQMARHHLPALLKGGCALEIHWRLASPGVPPAVEPADLWSRAQPLGLAGNALALCPEDALLHICAHASASHCLELGLRPLCDVRAIIEAFGASLSWEVIAGRAVQWQCARDVSLMLTLARSLVGADVPQAALDRFGEALPEGDIQQLAATHIFADHSASVQISEAAGRLLVTHSIAARCRAVVRRVFLPSEQMAEQSRHLGMGRAAHVRAVARRAIDLVRRYGWRMTRLAFAVRSPERLDLDRRNTLAGWLRGQDNQ